MVDVASPQSSKELLFTQLYGHLQSLARRQLGHSPRTSLDTSALIHDAYIKLASAESPPGRGQFLALASKAMRHVLVDHIRSRSRDKRGGDLERVPMTVRLDDDTNTRFDNLLEIESALAALERLDPRMATVVECRFFGGMEFEEIAVFLDISERTAQRDWRRSRAFLQLHLGDIQ